MRDTHDNMIEIVSVSNDNNINRATIRLNLEEEILTLQFSIQPEDYGYVKKILTFRPFENTGVAPYKYYFALSYSKSSESNKESALIDVRVEQLKQHKQFAFEVSRKFVSNLLWFSETNDKSKFKDLIIDERL